MNTTRPRISTTLRFVAMGIPLAAALALLCSAPTVRSATFTYTNPSCTSFTISGSPPTQTVTCVTSGGGSGAPVCSPSASPANPPAGQSTMITANCSNSPTTYTWTGQGCLSATTSCTVTGRNAGASKTFTITASNASGAGATAQITVTWH